MCGGNLGAPPNPPCVGSYARCSEPAAVSSSPAVTDPVGADGRSPRATPEIAVTTWAPWETMSSRRSRKACPTARTRSTKTCRG